MFCKIREREREKFICKDHTMHHPAMSKEIFPFDHRNPCNDNNLNNKRVQLFFFFLLLFLNTEMSRYRLKSNSHDSTDCHSRQRNVGLALCSHLAAWHRVEKISQLPTRGINSDEFAGRKARLFFLLLNL